MSIAVAITGDPGRQAMAQALYEMYSSYSFLDEVALYYRKNSAVAINVAAQELKSVILVIMGGDIFVGEAELQRFILNPAAIVSALAPITPHRKEPALWYPSPWSEDESWPFVDGLFRCRRDLIVDYPFPDNKNHMEDFLWHRIVQKKLPWLKFLAVQVPVVHMQQNTLPRFRAIGWALAAPESFGAKTKAEGLWQLARSVGWSFQYLFSIRQPSPMERYFNSGGVISRLNALRQSTPEERQFNAWAVPEEDRDVVRARK